MAHMVEQSHNHHQAEADDRTMFGFWVYIMTDLLMFAVLFAVYAVLHENTAGGEPDHELFSLPLAFSATLILLLSSFTSGLGVLQANQGNRKKTLLWFGITYLLGLSFLGLEIYEFRELYHEGYTIGSSAFMSAFYVLLGTHGLHIVIGLLWLHLSAMYIKRKGLTSHIKRKLNLLSLYWHFLDIVWIFIFTLVYLRAFV